MKIAVSSMGDSINSYVSEKFGRAPYFIIYNTDDNIFVSIKNQNLDLQNSAGIKAAEIIIENGAEVLLSGHLGDKAEGVLNKAEVKIVTGYNTSIKVKDAILNFISENNKQK
ncbi:MAG TPA: NifB/NifX family molybdenum-iron cluster-binding protein [Melioribacteraceae bacterium]|nr:NifB/NifX family molybdenum-iron cluster-binding protein [Melioribacteraceae bacterium]